MYNEDQEGFDLQEAFLMIDVLRRRLSNHVVNYEQLIANLNVEIARRDRQIDDLSAQLAAYKRSPKEKD